MITKTQQELRNQIHARLLELSPEELKGALKIVRRMQAERRRQKTKAANGGRR